jgi:ATP synthase protein I
MEDNQLQRHTKGSPIEELTEQVGRKAERKLRASREGKRSIWFGLGMFGLVGWSVAIPTLIGIAIGVWLDARWHDPYSWTLMGLIVGVALGCLNAWFWVKRESTRDWFDN